MAQYAWGWVAAAWACLALGTGLIPAVAADLPVFEVTDYGANLSDDQPDDEAWSKCLQSTINAGGICRIGEGTLILTRYPAELRQSGPISENRSLNGLIVEGVGEEKTSVHGRSDRGFDVFQLNAVSNLTIRALTITAIKTTKDETQGVNGISMTNGTARVVIEHVTVRQLPYVLKPGGFDGGKAFTVQQGTLGAASSTEIEVRECTVLDSPIGFGLDADPNQKALPGRIQVRNNLMRNVSLAFSLSFAGKRGGGADVPGFIIEITDNNLIDVTRVLFIGRAPDVVFRNNAVLTTRRSSLPDPIIYPGIPLVVIGGSRAKIEQNTVVYRPEIPTFVLIGGASGGANSDKVAFTGNRLSGPAAQGVKLLNNGVTSSQFAGNSLYGPAAAHDPALLDKSLKNAWKKAE